MKLGLLTASLLTWSAVHAENSGQKEETLTNQNVQGWAKLIIGNAWADGFTISGTNIPLTVTAGARWAEGQGPWTNAQFYYGKLVMNGETIYERTYPVNVGGGGGAGSALDGAGTGGSEFQQDSEAPDVRFASNHFTSGGVAAPAKTDITIVFSVRIALIVNGTWDPANDLVFSVTIVPAAYNRVAMWESAFRLNGDPWQSPFSMHIRDLITEGRSVFDAAGYSRDGMISDNKWNALTDVSNGTSAFINAHGAPGHLGSYNAKGNPEPDNWMEWSDISPYFDDVHTAVGPSRYQWVIIYACSTGMNPGAILGAFNVPAVDGAYLGFPEPLTAEAVRNDSQPGPPGTNPGFEHQASYLFDRLQDGYAIVDALARTNDLDDGYRCLNISGNAISMIKAGDDLTTWTSVYLAEDGTNFSRSHLATDGKFLDWKIIIE